VLGILRLQVLQIRQQNVKVKMLTVKNVDVHNVKWDKRSAEKRLNGKKKPLKGQKVEW
jgi:hypothetical protein